MGGGGLFEGGDYIKYFHQQGEDYLREAIILNISIKEGWLFEGGDYSKGGN